MAEHEDVYRTPSQPVDDPGNGYDGSLSATQCLSDGWNALMGNFWVLVGMVILGGVLSILSFFTCIGILLLMPIFAYGMNKIALDSVDGEGDINELWAGFRTPPGYGPTLGRMIVFYLLMFLISLPASAVQQVLVVALQDEPVLAIALSQLFSFGWYIFVQARFMIAPFFIIDQQLDGLEAFKLSWNLTKGHVLTIAGIWLLTFVVSLGGILCLVVGIIPAVGMTMCMMASAYRQLTAGRSFADGGDEDEVIDEGWGAATS